ncbi:UNVERIFIED_ORG: hydroxypyruvate isomerase [Rhizobium aethiopicum]
MRFSANLTFLYQELPFLERFHAAKRDGFAGVEYLGPYAESKEKLADILAETSLVQALFNVPSGNWDAGERGIACLPDRVGEFRSGVTVALEYADALRCNRLNVLAGLQPGLSDSRVLEDTLVANLGYAARACAENGIQLLIEPINLRDMPGFFVSDTQFAERILDRVGHDNLFIQYDLYHMQVMQGDLLPTFERLKARIGHVQLADNPGRHEPGTGEINFDFVLRRMEQLGYAGWFGCEYKPLSNTSAGLGWMRPYSLEGPNE